MEMRKEYFFAGLLLLAAAEVFGSGYVENGSLTSVGKDYADHGMVIPASQLSVDSYVASRQFNYPRPPQGADVSISTRVELVSSDHEGYHGFVQIGLRAADSGETDLLARDITFVADFAPDVSRLETWGYNHSIVGRKVVATVPELRRDKSKTILISFTLPAEASPGETAAGLRDLAQISWSAPDATAHVRGTEAAGVFPSGRVGVRFEAPKSGISDTAAYVETLLQTARALRDIGTIYYDEGIPNRMELTLRLVSQCKGNIASVQRRLSSQEILANEYNLLSIYGNIAMRELPQENALSLARSDSEARFSSVAGGAAGAQAAGVAQITPSRESFPPKDSERERAAPAPAVERALPAERALPVERALPPARATVTLQTQRETVRDTAFVPPVPASSVKVTPSLPKSGTGKKYVVQVGAYKTSPEAMDAVRRLLSQDLFPSVESYSDKRGSFYRVTLGSMKVEEFSAIRAKIGAAGFDSVWLR